MSSSVIRSICVFTNNPGSESVQKTNNLADKFSQAGFIIQTKRICTPFMNPEDLVNKIDNPNILLAVGSVASSEIKKYLTNFYETGRVSFNLDLTEIDVADEHVNVLMEIIKNKPSLTFNFTYVFNNKPSSPYFPSANYGKNGFSIGLQPTDLAEGCSSLVEWLEKVRTKWLEIDNLFKDDPAYLGIDSSIAPLFKGHSSLINFIKKLCGTFDQSVTTDTYVQITRFLSENNPRPIGLCGLMFPCLEDFELADEYSTGKFSIERNIFLSLHSGLGIDTYPIGVDESIQKIKEILKLVQAFSNKYKKPLSVRFVSDGKAKVGEKTNFQNQYLKDVVVNAL